MISGRIYLGSLFNLLLTLIPKTAWHKSTWQTAVVMNSRAKLPECIMKPSTNFIVLACAARTLPEITSSQPPWQPIVSWNESQALFTLNLCPNRSAVWIWQIHTEQAHTDHAQPRAQQHSPKNSKRPFHQEQLVWMMMLSTIVSGHFFLSPFLLLGMGRSHTSFSKIGKKSSPVGTCRLKFHLKLQRQWRENGYLVFILFLFLHYLICFYKKKKLISFFSFFLFSVFSVSFFLIFFFIFLTIVVFVFCFLFFLPIFILFFLEPFF